jgi:hypothetical protein
MFATPMTLGANNQPVPRSALMPLGQTVPSVVGAVAAVAQQKVHIGHVLGATASPGYGSRPLADHIDDDVGVMARLMSENLKSGFSALMEHRKKQL